MYDLLSSVEHNTGILKNVGGQTTLNTIDLKFMKCMKHRSVPQKKEIHTGLELHEGELQRLI